jgi:hypothetical protein
MERYTILAWNALRQVFRRQRLVTANLSGNAFLLFVVYSWITLNDLSWGGLLRASPVLAAVTFFIIWLQATTLVAFHSDAGDAPFGPALQRLPRYLPWAVAMGGVLLLFRWMSGVLGPLVWVVGIACLMAILPLASQAAGGGFSRKQATDIIYDDRYWLLGTALLVVGLYLPVVVFDWIPGSANFFVRMLVAGVRLGLAYFLAVAGWVTLASVIGCLGAEELLRLSAARGDPGAWPGETSSHDDAKTVFQQERASH